MTRGSTSNLLAGTQIASMLTKMNENSFIKACLHIPFCKPMANNMVYMHWGREKKKKTDPIYHLFLLKSYDEKALNILGLDVPQDP